MTSTAASTTKISEQVLAGPDEVGALIDYWSQGVVEIVRCLICLKQGAWTSRVQDVEEVDVGKLKDMVKVKDEDIAKLDSFVLKQEGGRP